MLYRVVLRITQKMRAKLSSGADVMTVEVTKKLTWRFSDTKLLYIIPR